MRKHRICLALILVPVILVGAIAQETDLTKFPGYVNLNDIKIPDKAAKITEITLGPGMLKLASMVTENGDEDLSSVLAELHGIQVKTFEIDELGAESMYPLMEKIEKQLSRQGWERLIQVKEEDERVIVSAKWDGEKMAGLLVMSVEPGNEAAFVNIVGNIDLNTLENFDIDLDNETLDKLKKKTGQGD